MSWPGRQVIVWRHGSTAWNREHRFQGSTDLPLDESGVAQAKSGAAELARLSPAALITSDLMRAAQTAAQLASLCGLEPMPRSGLREADLGDWEGLTREQAAERFPKEYASWRQGLDVPRGGGETSHEVATRAGKALGQALATLHPGQTLVAVTHGGTARVIIGRLLRLDIGSWRSLGTLGHGRWAVLEERSSGWRLAEHNARPRVR